VIDSKSQVYLYIIDGRWSSQALARAYQQLPAAEQQRVDRMCASGKQQLIVSLAVRRPLLARATAIPEAELQFKRDEKGKQMVANAPDWHFSVADTAGCVVLAVAQHQPVGVDVECLDRTIHHLNDFMQACLSEQELQHVRQLQPAEQRSWVLRAWVLKEAYTKRLGVGLTYGFQRLTVDPDFPEPGLYIWSDYLQHHVALSVQQAGVEPVLELLGETGFTDS
jgi:phosphopantetheinyl transferase